MDYKKYTIREISLEIKTGKTPPTTQDIYYKNGDIEWFTPGDFSVNSSVLNIANKKISSIAMQTSNATMFKPQTVLITCIGDIGKVGITQKEVSANQQITGIFVNENIILPKFFYYWLRRNQDLLRHYSNYAVIPILNNNILSNIPIYVPNLEEQNKIISQLESIQLLIEKRKETIELINEIIIATFLDMFGDPIINKNNYPLRKLSEIVRSIITYGIVQAGENIDNGIPYIRSGDIKNGKILEEKLLKTSKEIAKKYLRSTCSSGDIIMSIRATVGAVAMVSDNLDGVNLSQGTARIAPEPTIVDNHFLFELIKSEGIRLRINEKSKGATFKEITLASLREIEVPIPEMEIQLRFKKFYKKIILLKENNEVSLKNLETLFQSIQQKVFKGEEVLSEEKIFDELLKTFEVKDFLEKRQRVNYLVKCLNNNTLKDLDIYEKAKNISFELLNQGEITQRYDSLLEKILLKNT